MSKIKKSYKRYSWIFGESISKKYLGYLLIDDSDEIKLYKTRKVCFDKRKSMGDAIYAITNLYGEIALEYEQ